MILLHRFSPPRQNSMAAKTEFYSKTMRILLVPAILIIFFPGYAEACSCVGFMSGNPPCQSFWNSPVVFSGRVESIKPVEVKVGDAGHFEQLIVRFAVSGDHRGGIGQTVDIVTGRGGGDCGYRFETNEHYLVYASKGENGMLSTGICMPTKKLADAQEDLQYIQDLTKAKPVGVLFGGVWESKARRSTDVWQPNQPMPNIALTFVGKERSHATETDTDGKYRISDISPGEYVLKLNAPKGYSLPDERMVTIHEKGCSVMDFILARETSVSGRIVDSGGEPVSKLLVEMVPIEEIDRQYQKDKQVAELDANGRFMFRYPPPGSYYLGIGLGRWSVVKHSFPKTFYPGTPVRSSAAIIVVEEGQTQKDIDFQMPPKLAERKISGTVVFPNGKPVPKAAMIVIEGAYNDANTVAAFSDEDGRFELSLLEGLSYRVRAYVNLPGGGQRHAELVSVPAKGRVTNLKVTISEPGGSCAKCQIR